jgi:hypothetical protein
LSPTFIYAQNCDSILSRGIHDELSYETESAFQVDLRSVLSMSEKQRRERQASGSGSLGLKKILEFTLKASGDKKIVESLSKLVQTDTKLAWKSLEYQNLKTKLVSKELVHAWSECMGQRARGIQCLIEGDKEADFIVSVEHLPARKTDSAATITNIQASGAIPKGEGGLRRGATLAPYSGLSQIYSRSGRREVAIVINFDSAPTVTCSLPAIEPPPPPAPPSPPPPTEPVRKSVSYSLKAYGVWPNIRGDTEMDTNGHDQVPVRCSTSVNFTDRQITLRVTFYCEEYGGDHTTYSGDKSYVIFNSPVGKKIVDIEADGGQEQDFTGGTVGQDHEYHDFNTFGTYWRHLAFRVDGAGRDDNVRVGVGGNLEVTAVLEDE